MLIFFILPHVQFLTLILSSALIAEIALSGRNLMLASVILLIRTAILWAGLVLTVLAVTLMSDKRGGFRRLSIWRGILLFPLFTISWLPLIAYASLHRTREWEEIRHTGSVTTRELIS